MAGTVMPSPVFTGLDANGDPVAGGLLYTYAAGTTTPLATYNNADLAPAHANTNPVQLDSAGRAVVYLASASYKFILKTSASVTLWTVDDVASVPPTAINVDVDGIAGEALSARDSVYLSDGTGGRTAGAWYKTDGDTAAYSSTAQALGFVVSDIALAATGTIRTQGRMSGFTGLSSGQVYYASGTAGDISTTPGTFSRAVAVSDSTTSVVISSSVTPVSASATQAGIVDLSAQTLGAGVKTLPAGSLVKAGTGTGTPALGGRLYASVTQVGNVGAGEDDLMTYTLPANSLGTDAQGLHIVCWGTHTNSGNTKTFKLYFGATAIFNSGANGAGSVNPWWLDVTVVRSGASAQIVRSTWIWNGLATTVGAATAAIALNATVAIKMTAEVSGAPGNNEAVQDGMIIDFIA
jgi:hypothetical protein